tara:strand:+ start:266 stop:481 length:216 start_codon:yes stop_codon:yes gene_type:complete
MNKINDYTALAKDIAKLRQEKERIERSFPILIKRQILITQELMRDNLRLLELIYDKTEEINSKLIKEERVI